MITTKLEKLCKSKYIVKDDKCCAEAQFHFFGNYFLFI